MKKLTLCALFAGALFVVAGITAFTHASPQPKPLPLFFPLTWDFIMVVIGTSCVFHCECARRAALLWSIFCVVASFAVGAMALEWLLPQPESPMSGPRLVFMALTTGFGFVYAVWQLVTLRRPVSDWGQHVPSQVHTVHHS